MKLPAGEAGASHSPWRGGGLPQVFARDALEQAWHHVLANDLEDGRLASSIERFGEDLEANLDALHYELIGETYEPGCLTAVKIPKSSGGDRELQIPAARDRVVERALAVMLVDLVEPVLSPLCFAYRPGFSVLDAVRAIVAYRCDGYRWVVRADVRDCFPTVQRSRLQRMVAALGCDPAVLRVLTLLIHRPVRVGNQVVKRRRGLPQGGSVSPVLANLYLSGLEIRLWGRGIPLVRYSDDMVLLARSYGEALEGLHQVEKAVAQGGQQLGTRKTQIVSFRDGFAFLGEEFNSRYPAAQPNAHRSEPSRRTLYAGVQGSGVYMRKGRIVVARNDTQILSVPVNQVGRIVLAGSVGLSAGLRSWALNSGVGVVLLSRRGTYLGELTPASPAEAGLRRAQYKQSLETGWPLDVARSMVFAKLSNQRSLLMSHVADSAHDEVADAVRELGLYRDRVFDASDRSQLMGIEGIAARRYWDAFARLLPTELGFAGRARRPPPDVVNAALGYGYAILLGEAVAALGIAGLDSSFGVLHADEYKRPSLGLDLMEEWRPVIVDRVVLSLARSGDIGPQTTRDDPDRVGGVLLTEKGRRGLISGLEDRLLTLFRHRPSGSRVSHRRAIQLQAVSLASSFRHDECRYQSILRP